MYEMCNSFLIYLILKDLIILGINSGLNMCLYFECCFVFFEILILYSNLFKCFLLIG